tara:strand:- start:262 stop:525 length:264 start_codon:yes stop_codon:yes gene_type:complete
MSIFREPEAKPFDLESMAHRKVKYVLNKQDDLCEAFRNAVLTDEVIPYDKYVVWVNHIQSCELTVGEYLNARPNNYGDPLGYKERIQ